MSDKTKKANRLLHERSPYLQQHAYNPVDWYPWSQEAFDRAREEGKPIFLSIGYATCHWCHVMERESFENDTVAEFLNQHFVSIKVDREELPDIDHVYMSAVQALSGSGGWPMTLFLTPDLKPFFAGTYFPPVSFHGRPGFTDLLKRIAELWGTEHEKLLESAEALTKAISTATRSEAEGEVLGWNAIADRALQYFRHTYDQELGGFGQAPKFPRPVQFELLFDIATRTRDSQAAQMALMTLQKMAAGGMYDQLGGGFHRYSVDKHWLVPHFEKMLYDQAQLVNSYLDAFQITRDVSFAEVAGGICEYILRDLTHKGGGFFSAEDADSEGEEGTFYVWTKSELDELLGKDLSSIVSDRFGATEQGNFEHQTNVLHIAMSLDAVAAKHDRSVGEITTGIADANARLLKHRETRERPLRDEKILTSWNGLMIGAMARAGSVLGEARFTDAARSASEFVLQNIKSDASTLQHRWKDGEARFDGYLESYAFLIKGLLALYATTFEERWLVEAIRLQDEQDARLWDESDGAYFMSAQRNDLLFQTKGDYDGAEPNGNSVALGNLNLLFALTGDEAYQQKAARLAAFYQRRLVDHPYAMPLLIANAASAVEPALQIILSGDLDKTTAMRALIDQYFVGSAIIFRASKTAPIDPFYQWLEHEGEAKANLCQNFVCQLPMDIDALGAKLDSIAFRWPRS
jgi:uncharacterized protein YyaL (SSP411 family)